jgi:hypothetical protein
MYKSRSKIATNRRISGKLKTVSSVGFACLLVLGGWILVTPCPAIQRPSDAPAYIESVWPPATSKTLVGCYIRHYVSPLSGIGAGVTVDLDSIWELEVPQSTNKSLSPFTDRVTLYVDEEQVAITDRAEGGGTYFIGDTDLDLAGWYFFGSNHFVPLGKHTAKVTITTQAGEVLEYEWDFEIK